MSSTYTQRERSPGDVVGPSSAKTRRFVSIRWIVAATAIALTAVLVVSVGAVADRKTRLVLTAEIESRLRLQAQNLALTSTGALLSNYPELVLHPLVVEMQERQPELAFVAVVDAKGVLQGHRDARRLGSTFDLSADESASATAKATARPLRAVAPVVTADGTRVGTAYVGLERSYVDLRVAEARRDQLMILIAILVLGVAATYVLMSRLLRPFAPLRAGIERIGRGDLSTQVDLKDNTEFGMLADALNGMTSELKSAQSEMVERERLAHEMELAQRIQRSLIPSGAHRAGPFVIDGVQHGAAEVGGDYYDVIPLPDGRIGIAIADVAGKGLAGCLVASMVSALLRAYRTTHASPAALLSALHDRLCESLQRGSFVTMFYGVLDPESGRLVWASAGHNPCLVYRRDTDAVETVRGHGLPLCIVRDERVAASLKDEETMLGPGDVLLQTTDGVHEAFDAEEEQFGQERTEAVLTEKGARGAEAVLVGLRDALAGWRRGAPLSDDETLLVVAYEGAATASALPPGADGFLSTLLGYARRRGTHLRLPASLDALERLTEWLRYAPDVPAADARARQVVHLTLYELCANVIEHGCALDATKELDLYWVPPSPPPGQPLPDGTRKTARLADLRASGYFLLLDHGTPYEPADWAPSDVTDRNVQKRGRGFGLDLIHRSGSDVAFHPATPLGNLTIVVPAGSRTAVNQHKENRHA